MTFLKTIPLILLVLFTWLLTPAVGWADDAFLQRLQKMNAQNRRADANRMAERRLKFEAERVNEKTMPFVSELLLFLWQSGLEKGESRFVANQSVHLARIESKMSESQIRGLIDGVLQRVPEPSTESRLQAAATLLTRLLTLAEGRPPSASLRPVLPVLYHRLAMVQEGLGHPQKAIEYGSKARKGLESLSSPLLPETLSLLASLHRRIGQHKEALALMVRAREVAARGVAGARTALELARVHRDRGENTRALQLLTQALSEAKGLKGDERKNLQDWIAIESSLTYLAADRKEAAQHSLRGIEAGSDADLNLALWKAKARVYAIHLDFASAAQTLDSALASMREAPNARRFEILFELALVESKRPASVARVSGLVAQALALHSQWPTHPLFDSKVAVLKALKEGPASVQLVPALTRFGQVMGPGHPDYAHLYRQLTPPASATTAASGSEKPSAQTEQSSVAPQTAPAARAQPSPAPR